MTLGVVSALRSLYIGDASILTLERQQFLVARTSGQTTAVPVLALVKPYVHITVN